MFAFFLFFSISQVCSNQVNLVFDPVYVTENEQVSYFKSLQMRNFLGSGYEFPVLNLLDSQYVVTAHIGNPPQMFKLIPDIMTPITWVPSNKCWSLSCFLHSLYKSSDSLTHFPTTEKFSQVYGSGKVTGVYSNDLLKVQNTELKIQFGEANGFEGPSWLTARFDGVLSLSSLLKHLREIDSGSEYKIEVKKQNKENSVTSTIGGCEEGYQYLSADVNKFFQVGGEKEKGKGGRLKVGQEDRAEGVRVVVDLQTPLMMVDIKGTWDFEQDLRVESNCKGYNELPEIEISFESVKIRLKAEDYVLRIADECLLGIIKTDFPEGWENTIVLGAMVLNKQQLCFDWESSELGFKPN